MCSVCCARGWIWWLGLDLTATVYASVRQMAWGEYFRRACIDAAEGI
jgi:hypothetical protein